MLQHVTTPAPTVDDLAVKCQRDVIKDRSFAHIPGASFPALAFVCAYVADTPDYKSVAQLLLRFTAAPATVEGAAAAAAAASSLARCSATTASRASST